MNSAIISLSVRPNRTVQPGMGVADLIRPTIFGRLAEGGSKDVAFLILHPAVNFMNHYLIAPLQKRGYGVLGLNTRYVNNDSQLMMEHVIQDVGAGVKHLRDLGYKRIIFIGNSGGGPVGCFYQAQAENLTISTYPDGRPLEIDAADLPPVDGIIMASAHTSRAHQLRDNLDPAVIDENDPFSSDPDLDMFDPRNGPPYSEEFLVRYKAGQAARYDRINDWVLRKLRQIDAMGSEGRIVDLSFVIHRTYARPQTMDLSLDPTDRPAQQAVWGGALATNYSSNSVLGRYTTLRTFLSQWSKLSRADGPASLAQTTVPVLTVLYSGDEGLDQSDMAKYSEASGSRGTDYILKGATHFPYRQPDGDKIIDTLAARIEEWVRATF